MSEKYEIEGGYKVILVGDSKVGKSSILLRYMSNTFSDNIKSTIGADHFEKEFTNKKNEEHEEEKINLSIWDTAGVVGLRGLSSSYYMDAKCVILVFDLTDRKSFYNLDFYRDEMKYFANQGFLIRNFNLCYR